jgi:biotin carboxyl carrier protein
MRWVVRGSSGQHEVTVEPSAEGYEVSVDGRRQLIDFLCLDGSVASLRFIEDGRSFNVTFQRRDRSRWRVAVVEREFDLAVVSPVEAIDQVSGVEGRGPSRLEAPIPGKVVAVNVSRGDDVKPGQSLVVLEAMKMENELAAEQGGTVAAVHVEPGATVEAGALLVELE